MSEGRDLQNWIHFLTAQLDVFDAAYLEKTGEPHLASPELVAFLKVNNEMGREPVERAVKIFAQQGVWPSSLTGDQLVTLYHRAHSARAVLGVIGQGQLTKAVTNALGVPKLDDRTKLLHWLFVELWNRAGIAYLDALTNEFLNVAQEPPTESLPPIGFRRD